MRLLCILCVNCASVCAGVILNPQPWLSPSTTDSFAEPEVRYYGSNNVLRSRDVMQDSQPYVVIPQFLEHATRIQNQLSIVQTAPKRLDSDNGESLPTSRPVEERAQVADPLGSMVQSPPAPPPGMTFNGFTFGPSGFNIFSSPGNPLSPPNTIMSNSVGSSTNPAYTEPTALGGACKRYTLLAVRGTGENQTNPSGSKNLVHDLMASVPGGEAYEVVYPATFNFLGDPGKGVIDMMHYHSNIRKHCPSQKIAMFGYSQGAMVVINALNTPEMQADIANVRSVVVTGNPYRLPNLAQDRGTSKGGGGIGRIKNLIGGGSDVPQDFVPITQDYCNEGDPVCQGFSVNSRNNFDAHHYNGTEQEKEFIAFTIRQLRL